MYRGLPALQLGKDMRCTEACLHYNWGRTWDVQRPACTTTRGRTWDVQRSACITTGEGHKRDRGLPALQSEEGHEMYRGLPALQPEEGHEIHRGLPALQLGKDTRYTEACLHYNQGPHTRLSGAWGERHLPTLPPGAACQTRYYLPAAMAEAWGPAWRCPRCQACSAAGGRHAPRCQGHAPGCRAAAGRWYAPALPPPGCPWGRACPQPPHCCGPVQGQQDSQLFLSFLLAREGGGGRGRHSKAVTCFCLACWPLGEKKGGGEGMNRHTNRERKRKKERERQTDRQTDRQKEGQRMREREEKDRQRGREREWGKIETEAQKQTGRQKDRRKESQTDRQTLRTERETKKDRKMYHTRTRNVTAYKVAKEWHYANISPILWVPIT